MNIISRRNPLALIIIATSMMLILSALVVGGCGNERGEKDRDPELQGIVDQLYEIDASLYEISKALWEEDATGTQYLDDKDKKSLEEIDSLLYGIEEKQKSLGYLDDLTSSVMLTLMFKENLRQIFNTISSYILLRDAGIETEYFYMIETNSNMEYRSVSVFLRDVLLGREDNPYGEDELPALLLRKYMHSAGSSNLLGYYYTDDEFFNSNKEALRDLITDYNLNTNRIIDEVNSIELSGEWSTLKDELLAVLGLFAEQNSYLTNIDWPISDKEMLDNMLQESIEMRDIFIEKIDSTVGNVDI